MCLKQGVHFDLMFYNKTFILYYYIVTFIRKNYQMRISVNWSGRRHVIELNLNVTNLSKGKPANLVMNT